MLTKIFLTAFSLVLTSTAAAAQCGVIPNTLTNGQNADATQVMTNFNHLRDCINTPLAVDDTTRRNLLLNTAALAKLSAGYIRNINVFADGYKASDGINAGLSTGYSVNVANGWVAPLSSAGGDAVPAMTSYTTPSGTVAITSSFGVGWEGWRAFDDVTGGANCWFSNGVPSGGAPQAISYDWGGANKTIVSYTVRSASSGCVANENARAPNSWTMDGWNGSAWVTLDTRSGITFTSNEMKSYTVSSPSGYSKYRINVTANNNGQNGVAIAEIEFIEQAAGGNMTLVTTAQTADASVGNVRVLLEYNPVDAITLNTDLTAEVTCNNGTNWTATTLSAVGTAQSGRRVAETADAACGASGLSFAARIKTLNAKSVQIHKTTVTAR
jgi:hypothetical protein